MRLQLHAAARGCRGVYRGSAWLGGARALHCGARSMPATPGWIGHGAAHRYRKVRRALALPVGSCPVPGSRLFRIMFRVTVCVASSRSSRFEEGHVTIVGNRRVHVFSLPAAADADRGAGPRPAVLFMHGFPDNSHSFKHQMLALVRHSIVCPRRFDSHFNVRCNIDFDSTGTRLHRQLRVMRAMRPHCATATTPTTTAAWLRSAQTCCTSPRPSASNRSIS